MVLFGSCFSAASQADKIIELTVKKKAKECGRGSLRYIKPFASTSGLVYVWWKERPHHFEMMPGKEVSFLMLAGLWRR